MAEPKFEKDLERLEQIVEALEGGELPLDESLKKFEEGIKLGRRCEKALSAAEKKIEILMKNADGELEAQPFGEDDAAGEPEESSDDEESEESGESEEAEMAEEGELLF